MNIRINRFLSQAGFGSRRAVESLIQDHRVKINGEILDSLSSTVDPLSDRVEVDGRLAVARPPETLMAYHKPMGVVCSFRRQGNHRCLADVLPGDLLKHRLFHVGRLDRDSSGLLLLSDHGDLAHRLLHPGKRIWKSYRIRCLRPLGPDSLELFRSGGLLLEGKPCMPARIRELGKGGKYEMDLQEGRNRQIRKMFEAVGNRVLALERIGFGPVLLGELPEGAMRELEAAEREALMDAAGLASTD